MAVLYQVNGKLQRAYYGIFRKILTVGDHILKSLHFSLLRRGLFCVTGRLEREKKRVRGARWAGERKKRGLMLGCAFSSFRLLLILLANPAGAYGEERVRILGG